LYTNPYTNAAGVKLTHRLLPRNVCRNAWETEVL
jgi:hypothetical protein